jgi:hypothetical protein
MKKLIVILAIVLLPTVAFGRSDRYSDDYENERIIQMQRMQKERQYQQNYREYRDKKADYDKSFEGRPQIERFMSDHYNRGPQPPKR